MGTVAGGVAGGVRSAANAKSGLNIGIDGIGHQRGVPIVLALLASRRQESAKSGDAAECDIIRSNRTRRIWIAQEVDRILRYGVAGAAVDDWIRPLIEDIVSN